jgi:hypothetical protein
MVLRQFDVERTVGQQRRARGFLRTHPVFSNIYFVVITQPFFVISIFFPILLYLSKFVKNTLGA